MPTFYNFKQDGNTHSFDDVFIPVDAFRQGNLWLWGRNSGGVGNYTGQLGDNTTTDRSVPVTTFAGGNNWKSVNGIGYYYSAVLKTDGTIWGWGESFWSYLGNNVFSYQVSSPVPAFGGISGWKSISVGENICAIKTDGTLWTCGYNGENQLGINAGGNYRATPVTTFAGGTNWKQVVTGRLHTAAIKTDGTLWTWGYNNYGAVGDNTTTNRSAPVTTFAGGTNWKQVSVGVYHTAAIKTDGTLWTWGGNDVGQLGTNDTTNRLTPVTTFAGGTNWKQVSSGNNHCTAIKTDGTLWTWGRNTYGELGTNDTTTRLTPVTTFAGGTNWKSVSAGRNHAGAITSGTDPTFFVS